MTAPPAQFGMIGLGTMGSNLALNVEDREIPVAVWNREPEWVDQFLAAHPEGRFTGTKSLADFVAALERPRRIMMMITAGAPVDLTIEAIKPLLDEGDILIDGGNSWFKDTQRREAALAADGLRFMGIGVSGGEEGARYGPSLMPGGSAEAYERMRPVLEAIAAVTDSGPCVTHIGADGSGHFVKMVHNGIEYGDMQIIAEAYDILRRGLGLGADDLAEIFASWSRGILDSFLIELTAAILGVRDPASGLPLVDFVLDQAGQKGTGLWTVQVALELGVPVPTMTAALDARLLSSIKAERVAASAVIAGPPDARYDGGRQELIDALRDAVYLAKVCSYAQGMRLIAAGSRAFGWQINLREIARIWKGGCIIRARLLDTIMRAYERDPALANLLLDEEFNGQSRTMQAGLRHVCATAQRLGIPVPAMGSSLMYFDSFRTANLPQNLTQAQRDAFGAHRYQRTDGTADSPFVHTEWLAEQTGVVLPQP